MNDKWSQFTIMNEVLNVWRFDCARRYCTRCGSSGSYIRSTRRRAGRNNTSSPEPWQQGKTRTNRIQWRIYILKFWARTPLLISMQFWGYFGQIIGWRPLSSWRPSSGKFWICRCYPRQFLLPFIPFVSYQKAIQMMHKTNIDAGKYPEYLGIFSSCSFSSK